MLFERLYKHALRVTLPALAFLLAATFASGQQASSFQDSCINVALELTTDDHPEAGIMLTANCKDGNGNYIFSSIELLGMDNVNGFVTPTASSQKQSSFQVSCTAYHLDYAQQSSFRALAPLG